jgi:hypothetical protein
MVAAVLMCGGADVLDGSLDALMTSYLRQGVSREQGAGAADGERGGAGGGERAAEGQEARGTK